MCFSSTTRRLFFLALLPGWYLYAQDSIDSSSHKSDAARPSAAEIFQRRMLPILQSDAASSCTECHFAGVDLKSYIRQDQASTFAGLRKDGWVDVEHPDQSKILQFIARHTDDTNPLIARVRQAEYQAFRDWIRAAVRDPDLLALPLAKVSIGTELPAEVVRHMRRDHVLKSFVELVWTEMGRCVNCHSPERNQKQVREHGEQMSWMVPHSPAGTLKRLVDGGNIDIDHPAESMVLLKALGQQDHGGGPKFAEGSRADKNFRRFLADYAKVVRGAYRKIDQLPPSPADVARPTAQHLRITGLPAKLDGKLLKVDLYRWMGSSWSETPWGTAENPVNGKKRMWQNIIFVIAPRSSKRADELARADEGRLAAGRYLAKIYVDRRGRLRADRDDELGEQDYLGRVELRGPWPPGYQPPKIIQAPRPDQP